ncbi:MAG: STAS domain-containing protein [Planctomycetota bacterium]
MIGKLFKKGKGDDDSGGSSGDVTLFETTHVLAERAGGVLRITPKTEMISDRESKPLQEEVLRAADESGLATVVLDMKHVGLLASPGIGALVTLRKTLDGRGGGLAIYNLSEDIEGVLKITKLDKMLNVCATEADAVKAAS